MFRLRLTGDGLVLARDELETSGSRLDVLGAPNKHNPVRDMALVDLCRISPKEMDL